MEIKKFRRASRTKTNFWNEFFQTFRQMGAGKKKLKNLQFISRQEVTLLHGMLCDAFCRFSSCYVISMGKHSFQLSNVTIFIFAFCLNRFRHYVYQSRSFFFFFFFGALDSWMEAVACRNMCIVHLTFALSALDDSQHKWCQINLTYSNFRLFFRFRRIDFKLQFDVCSSGLLVFCGIEFSYAF